MQQHPNPLTDADRELIKRARKLAALKGNAFAQHTRERDPAMAMAAALGECQNVLGQLAEVVERLGGQR